MTRNSYYQRHSRGLTATQLNQFLAMIVLNLIKIKNRESTLISLISDTFLAAKDNQYSWPLCSKGCLLKLSKEYPATQSISKEHISEFSEYIYPC